MGEWVSVETPPEAEDRPYLVWMPHRSLDRYSVQYFDRLDGWSSDFGITHWMALPEPPQ